MIPEAREVQLWRKDSKVLEARCRSSATLQRDLKRARIVLLAAAGRSTRSIAKEIGAQPRIVSLWRHRYADQGLEALQERPRPRQAADLYEGHRQADSGAVGQAGTGRVCALDRAAAGRGAGDVDVQYVWRFLRNHKIDLMAPKSWCESDDLNFTAKAADVVGLYVAPPEKGIMLCVDE